MFVGHYGVALAAKRLAPRASLGALVAAAQLVDLIWPILLLAGVERATLVPTSTNPFLNVSFDSYPWTHSLLMGIVWGVLAGIGYAALRRDRTSGIVVGLLVVSHWMLDLVVHLPDLPLYPGGPRVGFGMWRSVSATMIVEAVIFVFGVIVYARMTRASDRIGKWAFAGFVALLAVFYVANAYATAPASVTALAWAAMIGWLIPVFGWWVDRHRAVV